MTPEVREIIKITRTLFKTRLKQLQTALSGLSYEAKKDERELISGQIYVVTEIRAEFNRKIAKIYGKAKR